MPASLSAEMELTRQQYNQILQSCREIFVKKNTDYGTSWRLFRPSSLTDQIFIKAQRIRNIETSGKNLIGDDIASEFLGIVNYSLIALVQLQMLASHTETEDINKILDSYDNTAAGTRDLMLMKNTDYGEAWRDMRISSFTDMILVKIARIKQIEDNQGKTIASEGAEANYQDIINYAIFALIRLSQQ
jgi:hypothetical protein